MQPFEPAPRRSFGSRQLIILLAGLGVAIVAIIFLANVLMGPGNPQNIDGKQNDMNALPVPTTTGNLDGSTSPAPAPSAAVTADSIAQLPSETANPDLDLATAEAVLTATSEAWKVGQATRTAEALAGANCPSHWEIADLASVDDLASSSLNAIAAVSADDIWAVGYYDKGSGRQTLTLHWDGSQWSVVPTPSGRPGGDNYLNGVAAISEDDVWAVGGWTKAGQPHTSSEALVLHWDGTGWVAVPGPQTGRLNAVAAVSPNDVWVGGFMLAHWDGMQWDMFLAAGVPAAGESNGVAAISPDRAWSVGWLTAGRQDYRMVAMMWDGKQWSHEPVSSSEGTYTGAQQQLKAVTAISPDDVWAVGGYAGMGDSGTLITHKSANGWQTFPAADLLGLPRPFPYLYAVSAASSDNVWAVGRSGRDPGKTLTMHWNGIEWRVIPSANAAACNCGQLRGVTAISAEEVWAVGSYSDGGNSHALMQHIDHIPGRSLDANGCIR